jgi:hypothetical protein
VDQNNPGLTEPEAERVSLIRYQLVAAAEAVSAPPPINSLAINVMQDVVESALTAAGDHIHAAVPNRPDFDKLFDAVTTALGDPPELTGIRSAAIALNNARVGFKHHGNRVSDETLRRHFDVASAIVEALVDKAFALKLDDVSMLLFIKDEQVRDLIEDAEKRSKTGDLTGALWCLRLAFDLVVAEYTSRKSVNGHHSVFETKPSFYPSMFDLEREFGRKGRDVLEKVSEWVSSLDRLTRYGALGIDLQRYAYFDAVAPKARYVIGDVPAMPFVQFEQVTADHVSASLLFVIDTAIRMSANDYTLREIRRVLPRKRYDPSRYDAETVDREANYDDIEPDEEDPNA